MQQFLNNRYTKLAGLTIGLSILLYLVIWVFFKIIKLDDFPVFLQAILAVLGAGTVVYKFLFQRIF